MIDVKDNFKFGKTELLCKCCHNEVVSQHHLLNCPMLKDSSLVADLPAYEDADKIEKIGEGTFGKVYKAEYRDPLTGEVKYYALKKLNMIMDEMSDQGFPLTALREIKYLSTLDHPNIVAIRQVIHSKRKYLEKVMAPSESKLLMLHLSDLALGH